MIVISPVYFPAGIDAGAVTLTVIDFAVVQQPGPLGEICSQLPPVPDKAVAEKVMAAPVLEISSGCGRGLLPPANIEKLSDVGAAVKPGTPTTTLTGMVVVPPLEASRTWPM